MTTRREIEQALADKSGDELNEFFDCLGFYKVNPGGATTEEERRQGILKYHLDLADKKRDRFTKICRGLDLPTPEERMLGKVTDDSIDILRLKEYVDSLSMKEFVDFYCRVMEPRGVLYTGEGQRASYTNEILECKKLDPGRWMKALALSGTNTNILLTETSTNATLAEPPQAEQPSKTKRWLRNNLNKIVVGVTIVLLSAAILSFGTSIIRWFKNPSGG